MEHEVTKQGSIEVGLPLHRDIEMLAYRFTFIGIDKDGLAKVLCETDGRKPQVRHMQPGDSIFYTPALRIT